MGILQSRWRAKNENFSRDIDRSAHVGSVPASVVRALVRRLAYIALSVLLPGSKLLGQRMGSRTTRERERGGVG